MSLPKHPFSLLHPSSVCIPVCLTKALERQFLRKDLYLKYSKLLKDFDGLTEGDIFIPILKNPTRKLLKYIKCSWKVRKEKLY